MDRLAAQKKWLPSGGENGIQNTKNINKGVVKNV